ncbi:hypothetical protein FOZ62_026706 [Perkinsus olseni]|uniref:Uncharacterized protein n=1 Tax=Perkinsus olseni TaxID=32597 RepID=A0A7J6RWN4_PEROL|nr:hypothetical protein FOZ62_026706 [Perkinsus olseni]
MTNLESESAPHSTELRQAPLSGPKHGDEISEDFPVDLRCRTGEIREARATATGVLPTNSLQFIKNVSSRITRNAKRGARRRLWAAVNEMAGIENFRDHYIRLRNETMKRSQAQEEQQLEAKLNELREVATELERQTDASLHERDVERDREEGPHSFVSEVAEAAENGDRLEDTIEAIKLVRRESKPLRKRIHKLVEAIMDDEALGSSRKTELQAALDSDDDPALVKEIENLCLTLGEEISLSKVQHTQRVEELAEELAVDEARVVETERSNRELEELQVTEMQHFSHQKRILMPQEVKPETLKLTASSAAALPPLERCPTKDKADAYHAVVDSWSPYSATRSGQPSSHGSPRKVRRREQSRTPERGGR